MISLFRILFPFIDKYEPDSFIQERKLSKPVSQRIVIIDCSLLEDQRICLEPYGRSMSCRIAVADDLQRL